MKAVEFFVGLASEEDAAHDGNVEDLWTHIRRGESSCFERISRDRAER
jgi:hypothetical protein